MTSDVRIWWNEDGRAMHDDFMRFVSRRADDDPTRYLARGLADLARRADGFHPSVRVFIWQFHEAWLGRLQVRVRDIDHDRVELTVLREGVPSEKLQWDVPARGPYEPVARKIAARLPEPTVVPEFLVGSKTGGYDLEEQWLDRFSLNPGLAGFFATIEASRQWRRLLVHWLASCVTPALAVLGAVAGLVAAAILVPRGFPGALLGVLAVPLGWAFWPLLGVGLLMLKGSLPRPSRVERLRRQESGSRDQESPDVVHSQVRGRPAAAIWRALIPAVFAMGFADLGASPLGIFGVASIPFIAVLALAAVSAGAG